MNVTTDDEALIELYLRGKTADKRYKKVPVQAIKGFKKAVDIMKAVNRIEDLFRFNGLYGRKNKKYNPTKQKVQFEAW